jgi:hypothetical protein
MRKCALPTELASLTDAQLAQVNDWLDRYTFAKVEELFLEAHGIPIGRGKLARYNSRRLTARALNQAAPAEAGRVALTAADLVAIKNGNPIPEDRFDKELLLRCTLIMAPKVTSAFHLRELHQIATYEERRALTERDLKNKERWSEIRRQRHELREREFALLQQLAAEKTQKEQP